MAYSYSIQIIKYIYKKKDKFNMLYDDQISLTKQSYIKKGVIFIETMIEIYFLFQNE